MQNANAFIDFGRGNTQAEKGSTYESALWMQLSRAVGGGGLLPPTFAAWLPNILAAGGAAWLLKKVQT